MNGYAGYQISTATSSLADLVKACHQRYQALPAGDAEKDALAWVVQTNLEAHSKFMQYACAAASQMIIQGVNPFNQGGV